MAELRRYHTARILKRCDSRSADCRRWIESGERYLRVALPPGSDVGNARWWTLNICKGCMTLEELNNV